MQSQTKYGIMLTVRDGYLVCPNCLQNKKLKPVEPDESGRNITVYCRMCKKRVKIDIEQGQCFQSRCR